MKYSHLIIIILSFIFSNCAKDDDSKKTSTTVTSTNCSNISTTDGDVFCYKFGNDNSTSIIENSGTNKVSAGLIYKSISATATSSIYKIESDSSGTNPYFYLDFINNTVGTYKYADNSSNKFGFYTDSSTYISSTSCDSSSNQIVISQSTDSQNERIVGTFSGTLFSYNTTTHQTSCTDNKTVTGKFDIKQDSPRVIAGTIGWTSSYYDIFRYSIDNSSLMSIDNGSGLTQDNGTFIDNITAMSYFDTADNLSKFYSDNRTIGVTNVTTGRPAVYIRYADNSTGIHNYSDNSSNKITYYPIGSKIYITSSSCNSSSNNITINKYDAVNGRTRGTFSGLLYSYSFTPPSNHVTNCSDNVSIKGSFDITRYENK